MKLPRDIGPMHFIGIGGIGMSGIAEVLVNLGYTVQGTDQSDSANVKRLRDKGVKVAIGHAAENLAGAKVVVISSAIKPDNPELVAARALPKLGPEPIDPDFTAADLYRRLHARRAPVKALLLDQGVVAGVGNIYADEACFEAGIRPGRRTDRLTLRERRALYGAIRDVLEKSILARGSSVINYVDGFGERGANQENLAVYGRAGEPCVRCGTPLRSTRLAGRTTVYCRRCQR